MKVLVIGSGGREHALCWRLSRSASVSQIYCAPGNPGIEQVATLLPLPHHNDQQARCRFLADFADRHAIDLTIVGPEALLCAGIADIFQEHGRVILGPSRAAAELEGSKAFAKRFMSEHAIPSAAFASFTQMEPAIAYVKAHREARVIKADGLAAGKGVCVAETEDEAIDAIARILAEKAFGSAGNAVVVEERLVGDEVSMIALSDGKRVLPLASSQDHKAVFDGGCGPNTGGMGAYSPTPILTQTMADRVRDTILQPTIDGMSAAGKPYRGVLYVGLMIVDSSPFVLEYNCRFGDPETQPLMARFDDDLGEYLLATARGRLPDSQPRWDRRSALCVVGCAGGYPGDYRKGDRISGLTAAETAGDVIIFQAGTGRAEDGDLQTAGGRVLGVTALGETLALAQERAYRGLGEIRWQGMHYRSDIGCAGL